MCIRDRGRVVIVLFVSYTGCDNHFFEYVELPPNFPARKAVLMVLPWVYFVFMLVPCTAVRYCCIFLSLSHGLVPEGLQESERRNGESGGNTPQSVHRRGSHPYDNGKGEARSLLLYFKAHPAIFYPGISGIRQHMQ